MQRLAHAIGDLPCAFGLRWSVLVEEIIGVVHCNEYLQVLAKPYKPSPIRRSLRNADSPLNVKRLGAAKVPLSAPALCVAVCAFPEVVAQRATITTFAQKVYSPLKAAWDAGRVASARVV